MKKPIDVTPYVTPTRFSGYAGVFLARALVRAAPARPSTRVRDALSTIGRAAERVRAVLRERMRASPQNLRPLDAALDAGWVGLRESLGAKARLQGTPAGERCADVARQLFPQGTMFVTTAYREQWAASQMILERIDEEGLEPELERLVGGEFVPFIRRAHEEFGDALGLGPDVASVPDGAALRDAISELRAAVADYGRVLAGELDRDSDESAERFRRAVAPLDAHRRVVRERLRRAAAAAVEDGPEIDDIDEEIDDIDDIDEEVVDLDEPIPTLEPDSAAE